MSEERLIKRLYATLKAPQYSTNLSFVKVYGTTQKKIKVVTVRKCRTEGLELDDVTEKGSVNDEKLENNISRAKAKIFEYAFCNDWGYFFTGTLDSKKYDRTDLEKFHKDISQFVLDQRKKWKADIKYLLIPERHSDNKAWHMHGFISGLPAEALHRFRIGDKMGKTLAEKVKRGDEVYKWIDYDKKFGFCDLEPIKNHEAVSKYVTKYVTKQLGSLVQEVNAHMYYCSRGLKTAETKKKGTISTAIEIEPSSEYNNDYVSIAWYEYTEENLKRIQSCITEYSTNFIECEGENENEW